MRVWIGETVRVQVDFTDDAETPVDRQSIPATGVSIVAKDPAGATVPGTVTPMGKPGAFYADFPLNAAGTWYVRAACTGPTPAADEAAIEVQASNVL